MRGSVAPVAPAEVAKLAKSRRAQRKDATGEAVVRRISNVGFARRGFAKLAAWSAGVDMCRLAGGAFQERKATRLLTGSVPLAMGMR